jgi:hypothetical protein
MRFGNLSLYGEIRVGIKTTVFWGVAPCSLIEVYQRFTGACCLHHQGSDDGGSKSSSSLYGGYMRCGGQNIDLWHTYANFLGWYVKSSKIFLICEIISSAR